MPGLKISVISGTLPAPNQRPAAPERGASGASYCQNCGYDTITPYIWLRTGFLIPKQAANGTECRRWERPEARTQRSEIGGERTKLRSQRFQAGDGGVGRGRRFRPGEASEYTPEAHELWVDD